MDSMVMRLFEKSSESVRRLVETKVTCTYDGQLSNTWNAHSVYEVKLVCKMQLDGVWPVSVPVQSCCMLPIIGLTLMLSTHRPTSQPP